MLYLLRTFQEICAKITRLFLFHLSLLCFYPPSSCYGGFIQIYVALLGYLQPTLANLALMPGRERSPNDLEPAASHFDVFPIFPRSLCVALYFIKRLFPRFRFLTFEHGNGLVTGKMELFYRRLFFGSCDFFNSMFCVAVFAFMPLHFVYKKC